MGRRHYHGTKYLIKHFFESREVKTVVTLLAFELVLFLFTAYKGLGSHYLPITGIIMLFTAASCAAVFWAGADQYLLVILLLLLNLGFVVQEVESGSGVRLSGFLLKFMAAITAAFSAAFLYRYLADILADDRVIIALMAAQIVLCIILYFYGNTIGDINRQGATLTIRIGGISFTPFEIVKVIYLFAAAGLLCRENKTVRIEKYVFSGEYIFVIHTILLSVFSFLCRELGTFFIIYLTGLAMLWIFGRNRKSILALTAVSFAGIIGVWAVSDRILYPMTKSGQIKLPGIALKLVQRFGTALHPERAMLEAGYQGTLGLEALASGGLLGIETERHRLAVPEASSDMIFANVVQTCGFLIGAIMLVAFLALLKRGTEIAFSCRETYFQGLAMAVTLVLAIENMVHIGYNLALLPITGIPLYFVSQGFTAMMTAMVLAAILLVLSSGAMERKAG